MRRSMPEVTYSSLCLPENITARGLDSVPNFYYRDDGLKLWKIINRFSLQWIMLLLLLSQERILIKLFVFARFVGAMVSYYYPTASDVQRDSELQEWIGEVSTHGFLGNKDLGRNKHF